MIAHLLRRVPTISGLRYDGIADGVAITAWLQNEPTDQGEREFGYGFEAFLNGWVVEASIRSELGEYETRDDAERALFGAVLELVELRYAGREASQ